MSGKPVWGISALLSLLLQLKLPPAFRELIPVVEIILCKPPARAKKAMQCELLI